MSQPILLRGAKQLLTLRGPSGVRRGAALHDLGIIPDGSVLIRDGIIAAVGTTRRIENLKEARTAVEIPLNGRIVMPGFIDASLALGAASPDSGRKRKKAGEFHDESLALLRSCLQHGTLAADVKATANAESFHADLSVLRKLAKIGSNPVRMIRTWQINRSPTGDAEGAKDFQETAETIKRRKLIHFIEWTGESGTACNDGLLASIGEAFLGVKLSWRGGQAETLANLMDRLHPRTVCCHSRLSMAERAVLVNRPCVAVFPTGIDVFEGSVANSARQFVNAGGAIALSSGYDSQSSATFSMQMAVALAVVRLGLTAEEAFIAATINAAYAAGCARVTGSLEAGKQADCLVLNVGDYREVPRQFGINHVDMALRQGSIVLNRTRWKAAAS